MRKGSLRTIAYEKVRFRRTPLIACILVLAFSAMVVSAGRIEDREDGTTVIHVTLHNLPNPTWTDTFSRSEVAGVKEFKRRFPGIFAERYRRKYEASPDVYGTHNWEKVEIELHQFSGIQVEGVEVDLLAIAGEVAADVLYVNFRKSDNYIQNGFLYPLDKPDDNYLGNLSNAAITDRGLVRPAAPKGGMSDAELNFRIHPKIWPIIRRKGPNGKKRVWAVPYGGALGKVLLYRKDLFDGKGIAYPTAQWTWDDLYEACRKLTDPKRGIYGLLLGRGKHESFHWITFLWSAGGEVMTYDEPTDQWRAVFGSREAAVALEFYTRLCTEKWLGSDGRTHRGYVYKEQADRGAKWERGEIGMNFSYIDEKLFTNINPEVTGMAPVPLGPTGMRGAELNSRMMGLFAGIKDRVVRDAAWEYIRFYESEDAVRIKTKIMVEGGLGRFVNPKYLRMFGYPEIERLAPKGWTETFEIAIGSGKPEPYGRNSNFAYDLMTFPIQEAEQRAWADDLPADHDARVDLLHEILRKAEDRANEEMIGIIPPGERRLRDITATAVLVAIALGFAMVFRKIIRIFTPPKTAGTQGRQLRWGFRKYAWAYVLLVPAVVTILVWRYVPLARGSIMAFQDYRLMGESTWIGVQNFGDLLWNDLWWASVWNALRYSFLVVALTFLPPIILAILLQEVPRGKLIFRTIYYLPAAITALVMMILWKQFFDPSEFGVLNRIVLGVPAIGFLLIGAILFALPAVFAKRLLYHGKHLAGVLTILAGVLLLSTCASMAGPILIRGKETIWQGLAHVLQRLFEAPLEPYRWLGDPGTAMIACVIPMVWAGMGPGCLIYLAALKGIPDDLYEAADVDGATFIDKILFVVLPILKPLIMINFIGVFIGSWYGATGRIMVMTGGGAGTEVAGLHIWHKAFTYLKFGPATAMAWVLAFMLIGFTVHQLRILSRLEFRTTGEKE